MGGQPQHSKYGFSKTVDVPYQEAVEKMRAALKEEGFGVLCEIDIKEKLSAESFGSFHWLWAILHSGDMPEPRPGFHFVPGYPLVPWIGVMAVGYGFGTLLLRPPNQRRKWLLGLGIGLTVAFIVIRATNSYGDPRAWATQKTGWSHSFPSSIAKSIHLRSCTC